MVFPEFLDVLIEIFDDNLFPNRKATKRLDENIALYFQNLFAFLYQPISLLVSVFSKTLSRKYEYEADVYAVSTCGKAEAMISALKKLSVDNLSNLTPHPLKVFLQYSHPPVLNRIEAIRKRA